MGPHTCASVSSSKDLGSYQLELSGVTVTATQGKSKRKKWTVIAIRAAGGGGSTVTARQSSYRPWVEAVSTT